jgi:hypothetical protein
MAIQPTIGEKKGPEYNVARAIRNFLRQMAESNIRLGEAVIKELMQNADDAGATEMTVLLDERPVPQGLKNEYSRLTLPALLVRNNAPFRKISDPDGEGIDDFEALCTIAGGHKSSQFTAAGRFGIGFNSVYFFTDTPMIFSRREIHVFDPIHHIFNDNGWRFPLDAFPADASESGPIKTIIDWTFPKVSLKHEKAFGEIAGAGLDYRQAILRLPLRQTFEGNKSLYNDCFQNIHDRHLLLNQMSDQAAKSILFLKSLNCVEFSILKEGGLEQFLKIEISPNPDKFDVFLSQIKRESTNFNTGNYLECGFYERMIKVSSAEKETKSWNFYIKHSARFDDEEIVEIRSKLHRNEERAIPWASIAIPKNSESLRFDENDAPAWRVFLPLLEKGPCGCVLNGAFFVGPSRQRAEFRSDGSDEALRKTNWNKCLIKSVLVPMFRNISIELTELVPNLIKQNPQDYLNLFPTSLRSSFEPESISQYFQQTFSEDIWCLKCYDIWDDEFDLWIGGNQEEIQIEMIVEDLIKYRDCFRYLTSENRKFIPWKLGHALRSRLGETSGILVQIDENVDITKAILAWKDPPDAKDLSWIIQRFNKRLGQDLFNKRELSNMWAFKKADDENLLKYDESTLFVAEVKDSKTNIHDTLKRLNLSFESTQWVSSDYGLPFLDPYLRRDFDNLMEADDYAALELLRRVKDGDSHDKVDKNTYTKSIVDFLCHQDSTRLPKDLKISFLVKTAAHKYNKRELGTIFLKPDPPTKDDEDVWEGLLRKTFAEVDPDFATDLHKLILHAPWICECLNSSDCKLEIAKSGQLTDCLFRAIQKSPNSCVVFQEELNRKKKGDLTPRPEAYRAAKSILEEAVERWEELEWKHRRIVLALPIHRAANGSLVSLLSVDEDEANIDIVKNRFYLQSEDDLKNAPISLPDRRLLYSDRATHVFYMQSLQIVPRDRANVLKECLKQIGDDPDFSQRLLEYIVKYYSNTIDALEKEGDPALKAQLEELKHLFSVARIVPCIDNSWEKTDDCIFAKELATKLNKQGWKGQKLDDLLSKLVFPKAVAKHESSLFRQMQQLGVQFKMVHPHEIPGHAIQSESPDFSLSERAKVVILNKESLPREKIDRAVVIGRFECPSLGGKADLNSLKHVETGRVKLPISVIRNMFPEAADIPAIVKEWRQTEKDVIELLSLLGVQEYKADEINSRLMECFLGLWPGLNDEDRISLLEYIEDRKDLAKQIEPLVDGLEVVLVQEADNKWQLPGNVISPKWAESNPPNLAPNQLPKLTHIPKKVISLWNEWCGLKNASTVIEAVVESTKSMAEENRQKAWNDFVKWLDKIISGPEQSEITSVLENLEWVLGLKGNTRKFMRPTDTISHPGSQVLAAEFWVVDEKLPRSITERINFKDVPKNTEMLSSIAKCLTLSVSIPPQVVYHAYKLVDEFIGESEDFKELWSELSAKMAVYRLMREPEQMATATEMFLGDREHSSDYGNLLWCYSGKAKGEEKFLKNVREIYRRLGVKTRPTMLHAIRALSKIEGSFKESKEQYASLVKLIAQEDPHGYEFEDEIIKKIRVLTCAETFKGIKGVYLDQELNRAELLSESSREFIINNRNRETGILSKWLNEKAPDILEHLGNVARIELTSAPQIVEVSQSASNVLWPWKDWFEQLAFEGSDIRERIKEKLNLEPPAQTFKIIPVKQILVKYKLPDGNEIIPSKEWDGPQALHDSKERIFVLKDQIEKDYLGKSEELEHFDDSIAEQVGRLLFQVADPLNGVSCHLDNIIDIIRNTVIETLERPSVILKRLRESKREHFFHHYQDQTADPEFSSIFERYQSLSKKSPLRSELRDKMQAIIEEKFVVERREQIRGYGYNEFSVFAELVQNAEDAYSHREVLGLEPPPNKSVMFKYQSDDQESKSLVVEHHGRPFNCWRHGACEQENFKRDVEGVLRSAGSFKPHVPSISDSEKPIGRFGLGFKCVYLITDRPKIHSGPWNFEIKSACIPAEVPAPDDLTPDTTRILLPLAQGVKEEQDPTGERLVDLMPFLRQVNHLVLRNTNGTSRSIRSETAEFVSSNDGSFELEWVKLAGVEHVRESIVKFIRIRNKSNPAQLGLYIDSEGYPAHWESAFTRDIYTVLPLKTHLGCGLGFSHLFELQSGRTHLTDHEGNRKCFEEVARLIHALPEALKICNKKGKPPSEVALRFWSFLRWDQGDRDTNLIQKIIAAALVSLVKNTRVVPTLDPEKCTSMGEQTVFCFTGIPSKFQDELLQVDVEIPVGKRKIPLRKDNVVPERFRYAYERTVKSSGLTEETSLTEVGWNEVGEILLGNDFLAKRPNLLTAIARSLPEEDVLKVKPWLSKCLLVADDNSLHCVEDLLPNRFSGIDHLPKDRMNRLHEIYDQDAVNLLKKVGLPSRPSIDDIKRLIIDGLGGEEGLGLLRYLNEAGHWRRHYHGVGKLLREPWFEGGLKRLTSREANVLGLIPDDILTDPEFRAWLGIFEEGFQQDSDLFPRSEINVRQILEKIHGWWKSEGHSYTRKYEESIYPGHIMPKLEGGFFEKDGDERRGWLSLLILGCTYTMGWTDLRKQKTFLETCEKRGWLEVFSNPRSSSDDWIYILDDYLNEQIEDAKWYYWMKQFISIYQISNYLTVYVNSFLSIENRKVFSLDLITRSGIDSSMDRGGEEAPPINRALGIGACFVVRELVRTGILTNENAHPYCYVPSARVRDLFIEELGCKEILTEPKSTASKVIYDFLVKHMGKEKATFNLSFDLPFLTLADNANKKNEILRSCTN